MIPEIDIWRAAQLVLKRYGEKALEESAARADELALAGDDDGATTWRRIMSGRDRARTKYRLARSTERDRFSVRVSCPELDVYRFPRIAW